MPSRIAWFEVLLNGKPMRLSSPALGDTAKTQAAIERFIENARSPALWNPAKT